ncbi:MAG: phosphohydrolase [Agathobacter sp.]|nr:phosphohydrolase [Agathobacter sp.]
MKFVRTDHLKAGMRLAKPIYNKNGVLLYDRNSVLTEPGIISARNFGLVGVYVLEPAEPVPPLSREDLEFEQLQTVYIFQLRECLDLIAKRKRIEPLPKLLNNIIQHYGALDHRVNFNQNLRSSEDFMYKHAISTAILVSMISSRLHYDHQQQITLAAAALLYDIGYSHVPKNILDKESDTLSTSDREVLQHSLERGIEPLGMYRSDFDFFPRALALMQAYVYADYPEKLAIMPDEELQGMVKILRVADQFDQMTAMNIGHEPVSEISAMKLLSADATRYDKQIVATLAECIHIVPQAANIDLSTGDKGIVLVENATNYMRPVILRLGDNKIYDLSSEADFRKIQILDIMKTMDNRISVDEETLKQFVPDEKLKELTAHFRERLQKIHEHENTQATQ